MNICFTESLRARAHKPSQAEPGMPQRPGCSSLWNIWYSVLVVVSYVYLFYSAVLRYQEFRKVALRGRWHQGPMNFYLSMITASMALLPLFVYTTLFKTGNYANDGSKVGTNLHDFVDQNAGLLRRFKNLRRHFLPYSSFIHVVSAYSLLIPLPVLRGAEILHGQYAKDCMWHTNLDFLFYHPSNSTLLSNQRNCNRVQSVSPEFVNFVLAMMILIVKYPATFWNSNRFYAVAFSVLMFIGNIQLIFDFCGMACLYMVSLNRILEKQSLPISVAPITPLILNSLSTTFVLVANLAIFEYGYYQYLTKLKMTAHYLLITNEQRSLGKPVFSKFCSHRTWLIVVSLIFFVSIFCCKLPLLLNFVSLYQSTEKGYLLFICVIVSSLYFATWIVTVLIFFFHRKCNFQLSTSTLSGDTKTLRKSICDKTDYHNQYENQSDSTSSSGAQQTNKNYACLHSLPNVPTVCEHVDINSESSYESHGSTRRFQTQNLVAIRSIEAEEPADSTANGLLKYAVRRSSTNSLLSVKAESLLGGSLQRNSKLRKSGNRVTFKEDVEKRPPCNPPNDLSQSPESNVDTMQPSDYFGDLFDEHHYFNQAQFAAYRGLQSTLPLPPPPEPDYLHVPDILMTEGYNYDTNDQLNNVTNSLGTFKPQSAHLSSQPISFTKSYELQPNIPIVEFDSKLCSQV